LFCLVYFRCFPSTRISELYTFSLHDALPISTETKNLKQSLIDWRRHFHRNPELSYKEYETSKYIAEVLRTFDGIEVTRPTETSVLGVLRGTKTDGPVILLRANIDALPVKEETGAEYESEKPSGMHAC